MTIDIRGQQTRIWNLQPDSNRIDQRCWRVMSTGCHHDIGMRPNLEAVWRVGGFKGPTHAISHPGRAVRHRRRIPESPGEARRPASDGSAGRDQSGVIPLRAKVGGDGVRRCIFWTTSEV
jgi:hypothetical protein